MTPPLSTLRTVTAEPETREDRSPVAVVEATVSRLLEQNGTEIRIAEARLRALYRTRAKLTGAQYAIGVEQEEGEG